MGLAAASAALKRKPKATAAAPVLVLAVAVRPQPASQRIFSFSYFLLEIHPTASGQEGAAHGGGGTAWKRAGKKGGDTM